MEGLVSFLHKMKKQKLGNTCCFSKKATQTRNYNKLMGGGAPAGSSLHRGRSHSQPPAADDHMAALELAHSRSVRMNSVEASKLSFYTYGSRRVHSGTYEVSKESGAGNCSRRLHQNRA